jgi:large subunit ribosomal protein L22
MKAFVKNIRIAPKKLNLIAEMVRGKSASEALGLLKYLPKRGAPFLYKAVSSAVKNAENNDNQKERDLFIETIYVGKGITLKRFMPVSRGRAHTIRKRCTMLTVMLGSNAPSVTKETKATKEEKAPEVKEEKTKTVRKPRAKKTETTEAKAS